MAGKWGIGSQKLQHRRKSSNTMEISGTGDVVGWDRELGQNSPVSDKTWNEMLSPGAEEGGLPPGLLPHGGLQPTGTDYHMQYCQHRGTATNCNGLLPTGKEGELPPTAWEGLVVHIKSEGWGTGERVL